MTYKLLLTLAELPFVNWRHADASASYSAAAAAWCDVPRVTRKRSLTARTWSSAADQLPGCPRQSSCVDDCESFFVQLLQLSISAASSVKKKLRGGSARRQDVAIFRQTAANFWQTKYFVVEVSSLFLISPTCKITTPNVVFPNEN